MTPADQVTNHTELFAHEIGDVACVVSHAIRYQQGKLGKYSSGV